MVTCTEWKTKLCSECGKKFTNALWHEFMLFILFLGFLVMLVLNMLIVFNVKVEPPQSLDSDHLIIFRKHKCFHNYFLNS